MSKFNMRGFTSLLLSFAFVVVLATGLVLWLAHSPQTFGIGKAVWKHTHIWMSLLMSAAAILHFLLNWSVYWSYLWRKASAGLNQKLELALALGIVAVTLGTAAFHPSDDMMKRFAAMNLPQIAQMSEQSVDQIVAALKKEGIDVHDPADSLNEIAEHNKVPVTKVAMLLQSQMRGGPHGRERE
jgi:hypothetical protein